MKDYVIIDGDEAAELQAIANAPVAANPCRRCGCRSGLADIDKGEDWLEEDDEEEDKEAS